MTDNPWKRALTHQKRARIKDALTTLKAPRALKALRLYHSQNQRVQSVNRAVIATLMRLFFWPLTIFDYLDSSDLL